LFAVLVLTLFSAANAQSPSSGSSLVTPDWCRKLPRPEYSHLERIPIHDDWFEVYRVAPRVLAIYEPHQWEETVMYLVEGRQRALLIDTGMGIGDLHALVAQLTTLPVLVVNTHTHADHTGGNWQFPAIANLDTPFTRTKAKGSTEIRSELEPGKLCGAVPKAFNPATYATRPWQTSRWLHDGDTIDLGGLTLTVLSTPGHTPDSLCLFDPASGLLFTGDTYYPGPIYVFGPGSDPAAYQNSVDRLAALAPRVRLVLGAHNAPGTPPAILPELAKEFAAVRAGKIAGTKTNDGLMKYEGAEITFFADPSRPVSPK
jgi:glyoxylase-like metal-dependent hydrolase (beta-lactamase superfamily II)